MKALAAIAMATALTYLYVVAADVGATRQLEAHVYYCTEMDGKSTVYIDCSDEAVAKIRKLLEEN